MLTNPQGSPIHKAHPLNMNILGSLRSGALAASPAPVFPSRCCMACLPGIPSWRTPTLPARTGSRPPSSPCSRPRGACPPFASSRWAPVIDRRPRLSLPCPPPPAAGAARTRPASCMLATRRCSRGPMDIRITCTQWRGQQGHLQARDAALTHAPWCVLMSEMGWFTSRKGGGHGRWTCLTIVRSAHQSSWALQRT